MEHTYVVPVVLQEVGENEVVAVSRPLAVEKARGSAGSSRLLRLLRLYG